jgi:hypothetical protein
MGHWDCFWLFADIVGNVDMQKSIEILIHQIDSRLFKAFLLLGLMMGIFLGSLTASASPSSESPNQQKNFLIALVENAEDETTPLLALWLAASHLESGEINWMPIYPKSLDESPSSTISNEPILLNPQDMQAIKNSPLLQEEAIWWDAVIVLDRFALTQIIQLLPNQDSNLAAGQTTLYEQVIFIQQICEHSNQFNNPEALNKILSLNNQPAHLNSTLGSFEIIAYWDKLSNNQFELICKHPWAE